MQQAQLNMELTLTGARYGTVSPGAHALRCWDDGMGPLWIYRESLGPVGIVRAQTWEEAYDAVIDEIMHDADGDEPETWARDYDSGAEEGELAEGCHWRGCGVPCNDDLKSPIACEDLNGSRLEPLTARLVRELGIRLDVEG